MTLNAIDMSKWGGDFTAAEARCCVENGVTTAILGTGPGGYAENVKAQADDVVGAGMTLEVYMFVEWGHDPAQWVRDGLAALGPWRPHVRRIWIDVEDVNNVPPTLLQRVDYVKRAVEEAERTGLPVGIYTGGWYWKNQMENTTAFARMPLWNSWYDNDPDIDGLPYGGWDASSVAIEQYQGTTDFCGQSVDLNHVYKPAVASAGPLLSDAARAAAVARIVAGHGYNADEGQRLTGDAAIIYLDSRGRTVFLGLQLLTETVVDLALRQLELGKALAQGNGELDALVSDLDAAIERAKAR